MMYVVAVKRQGHKFKVGPFHTKGDAQTWIFENDDLFDWDGTAWRWAPWERKNIFNVVAVESVIADVIDPVAFNSVREIP